MACHEEDSNQSCRHRNRNLEQRPNGLVSCWIGMFGQESSPCSSAAPQSWLRGVRARSLGHLLLVTGWRLGLLTEGKTAKTNRAEAWTSYRGEGCENKQGRDLNISQRVDL